MIIEVITTGNEILAGLTLDTNFQWAAERLTELSFDVRYGPDVKRGLLGLEGVYDV